MFQWKLFEVLQTNNQREQVLGKQRAVITLLLDMERSRGLRSPATKTDVSEPALFFLSLTCSYYQLCLCTFDCCSSARLQDRTPRISRVMETIMSVGVCDSALL